MLAIIYTPCKSTMQSANQKTKTWYLECLPRDTQFIEPIMGWTGNTCTDSQIKLSFETQEAAIQYAKANNIEYILKPPVLTVKPKKRQYIDNFKYKN